MKRSAAILGPTPQFVRWAINYRCPLREINIDDLSKSSFRELRSLRALSEGIRENRVFEDVCFHNSLNSTSDAASKAEARGFFVDEVLSVFGERDHIEACCIPCPANSDDGLGTAWAGCFGWLPADPSWNAESASESIQSAESPSDGKLARLVSEQIIEMADEFSANFPSLPINWYGLWMSGVFRRAQLEFLRRVFENVSQTEDPEVNSNQHFRQMFDAIQRCEKSELDLHVELVPAGFSDGLGWKILAHCEICKCGRDAAMGCSCPGCNSTRTPARARVQRVLGYRPYLMLKHVLGEAETVDLVTRYVNHNK